MIIVKKSVWFLHWLGMKINVKVLVSDENGEERKWKQMSHKIKSVLSSLD